ncbi:MAG TPA: DegQ family serine endoprotease [Vicinamibacterales bacterium]
MYNPDLHFRGRTRRVALALVASAALIAGASWHGLSANTTPTATPAVSSQTTTAAPPVSRSAAVGRDSYADVVKLVTPAVVTIRTERRAQMSPTQFQGDDFFRRFFGDRFDEVPRGPRSFRQEGLGSGVIVSNDGYILTNHHVVDGASEITVELTDGRTLPAKSIGSDAPSDLAVLKIDAAGLQHITLANSDEVQVGDVVLAIGNPLGIGQTVTLGIISAKGRATGVGDGSYEDFLQTDAPINRGNSGGALVNVKGELIGINSQILSPSGGNIGIGFAIPANMARHVMDQLREDGRVRRAQLGVSIQPVTPELARSFDIKEPGGALVSSVEPGSAADRAGIKRGDVIKSFNGHAVLDTNSLRNRVAGTMPGSNATVVVVRDGSERTLTVKLGELAESRTARQDSQGPNDDRTSLGVSVAPLTPELASRAGVPKDVHGLLVQEVNPDSRAAEAGIQAGDVIQEVNRKPVETVEELRAAVKATTDRPTLVLVNREGRDLFVTVRGS